MLRHGSVRYVGGAIEYIDNLHRDCLCTLDFDKFGAMCGYPAKAKLEYYFRTKLPGAVANYYHIQHEDDVKIMTDDFDDRRQAVLYIVNTDFGGELAFSIDMATSIQWQQTRNSTSVNNKADDACRIDRSGMVSAD